MSNTTPPVPPATAQPEREFEYVGTPDGVDRVEVAKPAPAAATPQPKHTPGPWHAVTGQGVHINDWYIRAGERRADGTWPAVARSCSAGIRNKATVEANARLIAAAPDLLALVQAEYDAHNGFETLPLGYSAERAKAIVAALTKANGGVA